MDRRRFVVLIGGALAVPFARAQTLRRVGVVKEGHFMGVARAASD